MAKLSSSPNVFHFTVVLLFILSCLAQVSVAAAASSSSLTAGNSATGNATSTQTHASSTSSTQASSTTSNTTTATATPVTLDTKLDPAFGVLGGILIVTGLPSTFLGHKNRWSSFFLIGFYTLSLVCLVLILKFGVLQAVNPPDETLRGLFVLACGVAGIVGGGITIFFWRQAKYFIGGWGGFAFALWIQCFHNGGLIGPVGFRWIFYIGCMVVGFVLCTIDKIHYHILLIATSIVGSTAFMLGVDCFTTANLKEFYMWNLGFNALFPKYNNTGIHFPLSQVMEIELGLIGALALIGAAVQRQVLRVLQHKLKEIDAEQRRRDEELEAQAGATLNHLPEEMAEWEKEHGRKDSQFSTVPLMRDQGVHTPGTEEVTLGGDRPRYGSGTSSFMGATPLEDKRQSMGLLPAMDLGKNLESDIPSGLVTPEAAKIERMKALSPQEVEDLKKKEELMNEINSIKRTIDALRSDSPAISDFRGMGSRHQSFASRRTISQDIGSPIPRPPPIAATDSRNRIQSMSLLHNVSYGPFAAPLADATATGDPTSINRPTSAPLILDDWNTYVRERRLYQPPSGVSDPIPTSPPLHSPSPLRVAPSAAVTEALRQRQARESALLLRQMPSSSSSNRHPSSNEQVTEDSDDIPLAQTRPTHHQRISSAGEKHAGPTPVVILPPRNKSSGKQASPATPESPFSAPRVKTFEELTQRHREKMRDMQAPLSRAEQEHAQLSAAKERWERSRAIEKQEMMRRETEKATGKDKGKSGDEKNKEQEERAGKHERTRTLSADKLARLPAIPPTSKRSSTMKVEDWQHYQREAENLRRNSGQGQRESMSQQRPSTSTSRRESTMAIPFPSGEREVQGGGRPSGDRRRSSRFMGASSVGAGSPVN